jgi:hypothetical protein
MFKALARMWRIYKWRKDQHFRDKASVDRDLSISMCLNCKHYLGTWYCEAFPDGIPREVVGNMVLHDRPLPEYGQRNKLVYQPQDGRHFPFHNPEDNLEQDS